MSECFCTSSTYAAHFQVLRRHPAGSMALQHACLVKWIRRAVTASALQRQHSRQILLGFCLSMQRVLAIQYMLQGPVHIKCTSPWCMQGAGDDATAEPTLSKSEQRRIKQVQHRKQLRDNIQTVMTSLHTNAASEQALSLLRPLHKRGHKLTKRERLRDELARQRAGLTSGTGVSELFRQRKAAATPPESESESEDGSQEV